MLASTDSKTAYAHSPTSKEDQLHHQKPSYQANASNKDPNTRLQDS